jgi:hypothetical protein
MGDRTGAFPSYSSFPLGASYLVEKDSVVEM